MQDVVDNILDIRDALAVCRQEISDLVSSQDAPVVQELILAQRHVEDARMRLGVALSYDRGDNPFPLTQEETKE